MKKTTVILLVLVFIIGVALAQTPQPPEKKQYIYVLKLIPRLLDEKNWTERENQIVKRHFERLQQLQQDGKLILAGRTLTMDPDGMGIFIFEASSEAEARTIMESDDAVQAKIMTAQLFPFHVALLRQP